MICPACQGKKKILGLFPIKDGECFNPPIVEVSCSHCNGTGVVDDKTPQWIKEGEKLREARLHADMNLRDASKSLNVDVSHLSHMELG